MSEEERKIVSYHEVGHALVTALQKKYRAGTEDHDRSENDGRAGVCDADSGRREVLKYKEGAGGNARWYARGKSCGRDCI